MRTKMKGFSGIKEYFLVVELSIFRYMTIKGRRKPKTKEGKKWRRFLERRRGEETEKGVKYDWARQRLNVYDY